MVIMIGTEIISSDSLGSEAVIGTLAVDRWTVTFDTARRPRPVLSSLYQM